MTDRGVEFEEMTADAWEEYLQEHDVQLVVHAVDGTHTIEWDDHDDQLTFWAHGSLGYDYAGSRAALEKVSEQSDGLELHPTPVTDGGTQEAASDAPGLVEPTVYESSVDDTIVATCPGCEEAMLLGEIWIELIVDDGHAVPKCPDCEPEEWREDADPLLDALEFWALAGDELDVEGGDSSDD